MRLSRRTLLAAGTAAAALTPAPAAAKETGGRRLRTGFERLAAGGYTPSTDNASASSPTPPA